jgi:DNA-binding MarR family transcriptional regulator
LSAAAGDKPPATKRSPAKKKAQPATKTRTASTSSRRRDTSAKPGATAKAAGRAKTATATRYVEEFELRSSRVFEALRELRRLSYRQLYVELYGEGREALEPAQYDALEMLLSQPEWRMSDYARALRVDPSTATRMLDRLVKAGVAVRSPSAVDARGINIRATRAGRLRRIRVVEGRRELMHEFLRVFTDDEIDTFIELMERLADNIAAVADERATAAAVAERPKPDKANRKRSPARAGKRSS